jgi:hypothetical protein
MAGRGRGPAFGRPSVNLLPGVHGVLGCDEDVDGRGAPTRPSSHRLMPGDGGRWAPTNRGRVKPVLHDAWKKGPLATASGPSLGRKRPRRAAVTPGATAPQQHTPQRTNGKRVAGQYDRHPSMGDRPSMQMRAGARQSATGVPNSSGQSKGCASAAIFLQWQRPQGGPSSPVDISRWDAMPHSASGGWQTESGGRPAGAREVAGRAALG